MYFKPPISVTIELLGWFHTRMIHGKARSVCLAKETGPYTEEAIAGHDEAFGAALYKCGPTINR